MKPNIYMPGIHLTNYRVLTNEINFTVSQTYICQNKMILNLEKVIGGWR